MPLSPPGFQNQNIHTNLHAPVEASVSPVSSCSSGESVAHWMEPQIPADFRRYRTNLRLSLHRSRCPPIPAPAQTPFFRTADEPELERQHSDLDSELFLFRDTPALLSGLRDEYCPSYFLPPGFERVTPPLSVADLGTKFQLIRLLTPLLCATPPTAVCLFVLKFS